jgi:hypothetical protein
MDPHTGFVDTIAIALTLTAVTALAALSAKYAEFCQGPAQWLMTPDEVQAFRAATTDEETQRLIDLFWPGVTQRRARHATSFARSSNRAWPTPINSSSPRKREAP